MSDNPLANPADDNSALLETLQQQREIPRLQGIITSGFYAHESHPWTSFLVRGVYDPRLFLFIFDFASDTVLLPKSKMGKFEK